MATAPPHLTKYLDPSLSLLSNPVASGWSIAMRYRGPTMSVADATNWVNEADRIYAATIVPLFLDHNLGTP